MAFKGTATRSAIEIAEEIEEVGGEVNAATSVETTAYYARVLKEDVPLAVDILSDILQNSVFDADELEREQQVIVQEIGAALRHARRPRLRPVHRGRLPRPADRPHDPRHAGDGRRRRLADARRLSRPPLSRPGMVLAAAGAVDHDALVELAAERFGGLHGEPGPQPTTARYSRRRAARGRDLQETQIMLGFEGRPYTSDDFYTAQVLSAILGGGMSSRLFQEVREKRGLCYSIYAFHWGFADTGMFGVHAATGPDDVAELMPVILGELERAADDITETRSSAPRPDARRAADDAGEPGGARRPDRPPAAAVRPADPGGRACRPHRGDHASRTCASLRKTSSPAARRRWPRSARSTA